MDIEDKQVPGAAGILSIDALRRWLQADRGEAITLVETHVSWVLLGATRVWKVKKPVRTGFLDFTQLSTRRACCEEEVRLNRRMAPGLYLGVVAIVGTAHRPYLLADRDDSPVTPCAGPDDQGGGHRGETALAGGDDALDAAITAPAAITVVDYAVLMRRFAPGALFSERLAAGSLDAQTVGRFAHRLAIFQRQATPANERTPWGDATRILADTDRALRGIAAAAPSSASWVERIRARFAALEARLVPVFEERKRRHFVRDGHGDLHLANVVVLPDEVTAFDCIEFDPGLRWIDVQNDAAFLAMDLLAHGRADLAWGFVDDWLSELGDYEGLAVLRYYLACRALVRALVASLRRAQGAGAVSGSIGSSFDLSSGPSSVPATASARSVPVGPSEPAGSSCPDYAGLVEKLLEPPRPRLLITNGVSGSGKSWLARTLLVFSGAIRLRSDVERKRLHGLHALAQTRSAPGAGIYADAAARPVYDRLWTLARIALDAGWPVIVDAAFLRAADRDRFHRLAIGCGVPFAILACQADRAVLRDRVRTRLASGLDPSEADLAVLDRQLAGQEALRVDERRRAILVDTARQPIDVAMIDRIWSGAGIS